MSLSKYISTPETTNTARVARLILGPCTDVLRGILKKEISPCDLSKKVKQWIDEIKKMKQRIPLSNYQFDIIFPLPTKNYGGDYSNLDISTLYILLRNVSKISPPSKGWGKNPDPADRSVAANIERIRLLRNKYYGHSAHISLSEFMQEWQNIRDIVVELERHLGTSTVYRDSVKQINTCYIDPELEHKYIERIVAVDELHSTKSKDPEELAAIFQKKGSTIRFNNLRLNLIREIPESELNSLKESLRVMTSRDLSTENVRTVEDFFRFAIHNGIFTERNVIMMQYLMRSIHRPDLEQKCIEYALQNMQAVCYFVEKRAGYESGYEMVQTVYLHVSDDIESFTDIDSIITTVASIVGCDRSSIKVIGLFPESDDTESSAKTLEFVDNIITSAMHDECRNVCIFKKIEYLDCFGLSSKQCSRTTKHKNFDIKIADLSVEDIHKIYKEENDCDRCRMLTCVYFECTKHPLTGSLKRFLEPAVMNQDHILLRLLVFKGILLSEIGIYIQRLSQQVQQRYLSETIALSIKQRLLEKYRLKNKSICQVRLCLNTNDKDTLVVCILYHLHFAEDKRLNGLPVIWRSFKRVNEESYLVLKEESIRSRYKDAVDFRLPTISSYDAQKLFNSHCNLTMILASRLKSRGFLKKEHTIEQNVTISLFCRHKYLQPLGESPFPQKIGNFDVDVLEGYCSLGNRNVEIGDEIHCDRADQAGFRIDKSGSVGGFVKLQNDLLGVITCAHVLYSADDLEKAAASNRACGSGSPLRGGLETGVPASIGARRKCRGTVVKACFTPDRITSCVDAAVVGLDSSYTADGTFAKTKVKLDQILFAGFDLSSIPRFTGRYYRGDVPQSDIGHRVIKTGMATGLTCGTFYMSGSHVRMEYEEMKINENTSTGLVQKSFKMYDQIAVLSSENQDFFEIGDSGSFVFVRHPDQGLICVGMAIGKTTNNLCLVTPIRSILDSLELQDLYCPEGEPMDTGSGAISNPAINQYDLMAVLSQISSDIRSMKTDIQELKNPSAQGRGASNGN